MSLLQPEDKKSQTNWWKTGSVILTIILVLGGIVFLWNRSNRQQSFNSNIQSNNNVAANSVENTNTNTKKEDKSKPINTAQDAINDFLQTKYPGWTQKGNNLNEVSFFKVEYEPVGFDIHIEKGKESKILSVMLRLFSNSKGESYYRVDEQTPLDLIRSKLDKLREQVSEDTLANLTVDQIDDATKEAIIEQWQEEMASQEQDYDPR